MNRMNPTKAQTVATTTTATTATTATAATTTTVEQLPITRKRPIVPNIVMRLCFTIVFVLNVQCALQFVITPEAFAGAYELSGVPGEVAIRGLGIAFLMWNVTYPAFIAAPRRFKALGIVVLVQQIVGFVGESLIWVTLPAGHGLLAGSILRFMLFDGIGFVIMLASFIWFFSLQRKRP